MPVRKNWVRACGDTAEDWSGPTALITHTCFKAGQSGLGSDSSHLQQTSLDLSVPWCLLARDVATQISTSCIRTKSLVLEEEENDKMDIMEYVESVPRYNLGLRFMRTRTRHGKWSCSFILSPWN